MKVHKKIVNGIYETDKMFLTIKQDSVQKLFKPYRKSQRRYHIEKESLIRLSKVNGTPNLISADDDKKTIIMSKLSGETPTHLNKANLQDLIVIVNKMLDAGVARHAMPIRDIIVDTSNNKLGLVDFERSTLRGSFYKLDWIVAKKVTHYHLYRLIAQFQPNLLTSKQTMKLNIVTKIRHLFRR